MFDISVIIPIYGVERYIKRFSKSLFGQTMTQNVEFIFVNDCTVDNSIAILNQVLQAYPHLVSQTRIIHNKENRGLAETRRIGIMQARGEYILCLDSDDYVDKTMLEEMFHFAKDNDCDVVIVDYYSSTPKSTIYNSQKPSSLIGKDCMLQILKMELHGSWWNKLIKRSILDSQEIHYPPLRRDMLEDLMVTSQILFYASNIGYLNKAFYYYCQYPDSISHNMSKAKLESILYAYNLIADFFSRNKIEDQHSLKALECFRISTLSVVALYGCRDNLTLDFKQYRKLLPCVYKHPRLTISYKIALMAQILQMKYLVKILIYIRKILR